MTWRDFSIYVLAHQRNELNEWARTRKLAHTIYSTVVESKNWKDEKTWWSLPQDERPEPLRPPTDEEVQRMIQLLQTPNKAQA